MTKTTWFTCSGGCSHCLTVIDLQRQNNDLHICHNLYINLKNKTRTTCFQCQWWSDCNPTKKNYGQSAVIKGSNYILSSGTRKELHYLFKTRWWWWWLLTRTMTRPMMMVCSKERGSDWWELALVQHWQSGEQRSSDQRARRPDHGECCVVTADHCFGDDYIMDNDDIQGVLEIFSG